MPATPEQRASALADATQAVLKFVRDAGVQLRDGYDDAAALPPLDAGDDCYTLAAKFKDLGNTLFKSGEVAWALRTYLVGVKLLELLRCLDDDEPTAIVYDIDAQPVCIAAYSNAALMALKLEHHQLCAELCDHGLIFGPEGGELAKLLHRKAQAILDRQQHADPEAAIDLLQRAVEAQPGSRAIRELLQRARSAAKEKARAASKALFGGKGFGSARLASGAASRADAAKECDDQLRRGWASLLGVDAERSVDPYPDAKRMLHGEEAAEGPTRDATAARDAFAAAEAAATTAGLGWQRAHALYGRAAAASEMREWRQAAEGFGAYFRLAEELCGQRAGEVGAAAAAAAREYREPHLGSAYARYHTGVAWYELREVHRATAELEGYLEAQRAFEEVRIAYTDEWGNETLPALEKELQRQRTWMVGPRVQYSARRRLAHLRQLAADDAVAASTLPPWRSAARALLLGAAEQLEACVTLAWQAEQRDELHTELNKTQAAIAQLEQLPPADAGVGVHVDARGAGGAAAAQAAAEVEHDEPEIAELKDM